MQAKANAQSRAGTHLKKEQLKERRQKHAQSEKNRCKRKEVRNKIVNSYCKNELHIL
jgi:hypothetical protein